MLVGSGAGRVRVSQRAMAAAYLPQREGCLTAASVRVVPCVPVVSGLPPLAFASLVVVVGSSSATRCASMLRLGPCPLPLLWAAFMRSVQASHWSGV